jgi:hypothetical protein
MSKYTVAQTLRDALQGQPKLKFTPPSRQLTYRHSRWDDSPRWTRDGSDNRWRTTDNRRRGTDGRSRSPHTRRDGSGHHRR